MGPKKQPGTQLGKALLDMFVDGVVKARAGVLPHEQAEKTKATIGMMDHLEGQFAPLSATWTSELLEMETLPDGLRAALTEMETPEHAIGFLLQIIGWIGYLMSALGASGGVMTRQLVMDLNKETLNVPLTPADAADAVMRSILTETTGAKEAAKAGISAEVFAEMISLVGEPPGIMDMLTLWRRTIIDWNQLESMIAYSRVKTEYAYLYRALAHSYMSPADVIELAVKGVVTPTLGKTMFTTAGGLETQWDQLYLGAGDAIGVEKAMTLWNHGLIDEAQVDEIIGRSRINPHFYGVAKQQRHRFLGVYQIHQALKAGTVDAATGTQWLLEEGLDPQQAAAFAQAGAGTGHTKVKAETESMIVSLYVDQVVTHTEAETMLENLGYPATVALIILDLADAKRVIAQRNAAVGSVRSAYVAGHISPTQAGIDLDKLNIPPAARDAWLQAWAIEQTTKVKELSMAQVGHMVKNGIIDDDEAMRRWGVMGYTGKDAQLLLAVYTGPLPPTSPAAKKATSGG